MLEHTIKIPKVTNNKSNAKKQQTQHRQHKKEYKWKKKKAERRSLAILFFNQPRKGRLYLC